MTSPVVVTGASGFIGSHLRRDLSARDIPVIALTRNAVAVEGNLQAVNAYPDYAPPEGATLIHLAEPPHIASVDAEGECHVTRMADQASALLSRGYRRAIYVSSATVYGDTVTTPRRPDEKVTTSQKVYAQAKLTVERLFLAAGGVIARVTNVYGVGMARGTIFTDIIDQLGRPGPVVIRETTPVRDYLWVEDAASALASMAERRSAGIYNVASGTTISCAGLAEAILAEAGEDREVIGALPPRHSELKLDISATQRDFGWVPRVDLRTGIRTLLKHGHA